MLSHIVCLDRQYFVTWKMWKAEGHMNRKWKPGFLSVLFTAGVIGTVFNTRILKIDFNFKARSLTACNQFLLWFSLPLISGLTYELLGFSVPDSVPARRTPL